MESFTAWLEAFENGGYGYHLTPRENLPGIAAEGLVVNRTPNWHGHHALNSQNGIFYTIDPKQLPFWSQHYIDPILLRFHYDLDELVGTDCNTCKPGNYYLPRNVPPQDVEVWTGKEWISVSTLQRQLPPSGKYKYGKQRKALEPRTLGNLPLNSLYTHKGKSTMPKNKYAFGKVTDYPDYKPASGSSIG